MRHLNNAPHVRCCNGHGGAAYAKNNACERGGNPDQSTRPVCAHYVLHMYVQSVYVHTWSMAPNSS